jgi:hypothetical protein
MLASKQPEEGGEGQRAWCASVIPDKNLSPRLDHALSIGEAHLVGKFFNRSY